MYACKQVQNLKESSKQQSRNEILNWIIPLGLSRLRKNAMATAQQHYNLCKKPLLNVLKCHEIEKEKYL